jgi:hypothetical protein
MKLEELKQMEEECIRPEVAAKVIGCNPNKIRLEARDNPKNLGFPVTRMGRDTYIPRRAFIRFMEGGRLIDVNAMMALLIEMMREIMLTPKMNGEERNSVAGRGKLTEMIDALCYSWEEKEDDK